MTGERRLRLRDADVHWQDLDGEVVALEARQSAYLAANPAGSLLWRALVDGSTRDELARGLVDEFGIDHDRALADTDVFLEQLTAWGLLEP
ncbi:MAG TPA: PqqD family protein [Solirubrobacteraceae bacterium]|nr:PqqD family protein [Solirubrobacteraceae bacterium]